MTIISTDKWLKKNPDERKICKELVPYFHSLKEKEILNLLHSFGMYKNFSGLSHTIQELEERRIWSFVRKEADDLKEEWNGPDIPIFIFPTDERNKKIMREYKGRAGLAFKDKIFLFISPTVQKEDVKSLLTHEYHHTCRLAKLKKEESMFCLLDVIIMEGLAEYAVLERLSGEHLALWTSYYREEQAVRFLKNIILPNQFLKRDDHKFTEIMYGRGFYPKMLGYFVGFHIVKKYSEKTGRKTADMFEIDAAEFTRYLL
ncbi:DUF2268 domain-containing protein [Metabacillus fastidiosus]|uniref:DUF2268 domain-containing protein n=1 Tax=Metabacillus fastidiosus TaxID=1458 RepID=UPI003D28323A